QNEREVVTLAQPQNGRTVQVTGTANRESFVVGKDGLSPSAKKQEPGSLDGQPIGINPQVIDARPGNSTKSLNSGSQLSNGGTEQNNLKLRNEATVSLAEAAKSNSTFTAGQMQTGAAAATEVRIIPSANSVAWAAAARHDQSAAMTISTGGGEASITSLD